MTTAGEEGRSGVGGHGPADGLTELYFSFLLGVLLARLKPCRCYKTDRQSFSASGEAVPLLQNRSAEFFSKR
jgi:hypothetical protein